MRGDDDSRAVVAGERGQRGEAAAPKPTGCPRSPRWNGAATAAPCRDRRGDARDRRRLDPRHVGERNDPAGGVRASPDAAREARAHAVVGARAANERRAAAPSAAASAASSGRTTAMTRGSAARRLRHAVAPMHSPAAPQCRIVMLPRRTCRCMDAPYFSARDRQQLCRRSAAVAAEQNRQSGGGSQTRLGDNTIRHRNVAQCDPCRIVCQALRTAKLRSVRTRIRSQRSRAVAWGP